MRPERLKRRAKRMLARHRDEMTPEQQRAVEQAIASPDLLRRWSDSIKTQMNPPEETLLTGMVGGIAWDNVWNWFKANWPTILKLLLTLLVAL